MKKGITALITGCFILLVGMVVAGRIIAAPARYDTLTGYSPAEIQAEFNNMHYTEETATVTLKSSVTFYGYVTMVSVKAAGNNVKYSTNRSSGVFFLASGDSYSSNYAVAVDSPTRIDFESMLAGTTVQVTMGGFKK